ncbi:hypothetical protein FQN57_000992 [Myotisia sp. PD_48]|nr:hypothetical protein FQN57_000992 [Myotisia sp. PD_48]
MSNNKTALPQVSLAPVQISGNAGAQLISEAAQTSNETALPLADGKLLSKPAQVDEAALPLADGKVLSEPDQIFDPEPQLYPGLQIHTFDSQGNRIEVTLVLRPMGDWEMLTNCSTGAVYYHPEDSSRVKKGIFFERAIPGCIRLYFRDGGQATREERIRWSHDLADVLQFVHDLNVRHGDLGGRNILLDAKRNIKLCAFAGSGIDDELPYVAPQTGFSHPDREETRQCTIKAELHALGSTIYEIVTPEKPFGNEDEDLIEEWIKAGKYPDVQNVLLGDIISKRWKGDSKSAQEVAQSIKKQMER